MSFLKTCFIFLTSVILISCGGGGGSSSGNGSNPPSPTPSTAVGVNIGNISTIPLGPSSSSTFLIVTNNYPNSLILSSATYTPYDSDIPSTPHDATTPGSPVNVGQCATVQANGSCSIVIAVPAEAASNGRYLVTMNFTNSATGTMYTTSQIVSYSDIIPDSTTGIEFSTINNTIYNRVGRSTTYTVPFLLHEQLDNISATSEYNNPAFIPAINCPGKSPYPAGTLCTLYVRISDTGTNSLISGNIIVSNSNSSLQRHIKDKSRSIAASQTGYLFNVPVTVVQNNNGNLVTSSINTIISPANGANPKTIILLNNGAGPITGISVSSSGVVTTSTGCSGTLDVGIPCSFTVNANQTTNGQSIVTVNYTSGTTNSLLAFNVAYIATATVPAMAMTANGTLVNTVINNSVRTINIKVANPSTAQLNNIIFTPQSSLPAGMTYVSGGSSCATDGTQSLSPGGDSCILQIQYAPTAVSSGTLIIREAAQYITQDGNIGSFTATSLGITYSAITGNAFVYLIPNPVSYAIRANGVESQTQTFTFVNTNSSLSAVILSESLANPGVANYTTTGGGGTCLPFPHTLGAVGSGTESCTVIATYGPVSTTVNTTSQMTANYVANSATGESAITLSALSFTASKAALIIVQSVTLFGTVSSGNGFTTPYQVFNYPNCTSGITVSINYSNSGTQTAESFNVAANNAPVGYNVDPTSSNCGYGSTTSTIAPGGICTIQLDAVCANFYNPTAFTGPLNINIPGYSYKDTATGLNTNTAPTFSPYGNTILMNENLWTNVTTGNPTNWSTGTGGGGPNSFVFASATDGLTITIPSTQLTIFTLSAGGTCTTSGGGCQIGITNPAGYPLNSPVNFLYIVSDITTNPGQGLIKTASFSYSN